MAIIFVSYNRQSKEITTTLVNDIEALGHTVWYDQELSGGQAWWDKILSTIRGCDIFVSVLDPAALNSAACKRECEYAVDLGKPVLPVLVSEGVSINLLPPALSQIQFVDYQRPDRQAALRLARAFAAVPPPKPLPDPLPLPPEVPISYLGGLTAQVETTSTLSYQQQSALVIDLRRGLHNPETADDTRTLLTRLRKRHDLFAKIAEEIDELLGSPRQTPSVQPHTPVMEHAQKVETSQQPGISSPPAAAHKTTRHQRKRGGFIGAGVGVVVGVVTCLSFGESSGDYIFSAIILGIAGAIVGMISSMHRRVIIISLIGFVLGFTVWAMTDQGGDGRYYGILRAIDIGGPIGAIPSAIVGAIIRKIRGWT